jgi:2-polyprenyl-3-methyl-5-hydroxy-6-metoxy-1,4-benzoquinol methylase
VATGDTGRNTNTYFDGESEAWSARYTRSRHFQARLRTAMEWIGAHGGPLSLLDYGCGSGVLLRELAPLGHRLTGVDASDGMLASARKDLSGVAEVTLERAGDAAAAHTSQHFDGVTCLGVIEYVDAPQALLKTLAERVRPGGFLIVSFPNDTSVLRTVERWIFKHATLFRALGLFKGITGPESYLHFQKHRFALADISAALGLAPARTFCHVAPSVLGKLEHHPRIGMTTIAEFIKPDRA